MVDKLRPECSICLDCSTSSQCGDSILTWVSCICWRLQIPDGVHVLAISLRLLQVIRMIYVFDCYCVVGCCIEKNTLTGNRH